VEKKEHDLVIIGAGPGGYVAAIRAAQLGMNVACIEKESALGGTCLRVGCIPSKALLESSERYEMARHQAAEHGVLLGEVGLDLGVMLGRKDKIVDNLTKGVAFLFKKNKVTLYSGAARFTGPSTVAVEGNSPVEVSGKRFLIATGSSPATIPGVAFDGNRIGSSTEALAYSEIPARLVVIGAGVIGLELGSVWRRLGSKVTVLEYLDRILPEMDEEIAKTAARSFKKQGMDIRTRAKVMGAQVHDGYCVVEVEGGEPLQADKVLVAVGRRPHTEGLGLEAAGVKLNEKGRIIVNDTFQTTAKNIYAIGDVIGGAMLAHKASDEGMACVEMLAGKHGHINYGAIPSVVYTDPEVAAVGRHEADLVKDGVPFKKGSFLFRANGRAMSLGSIEGMVKILAHAETDRVLGVHIVGPRAGDLIAEAAVAMEYGASSEDLARACHAHPSLSEAIKEAALAVDGRAIHA
jgi:dihydrolipoamide dehydrogenase